MDDQAFPDADSIYPAVNQWYGDGRPTRGDIENLDDLKQLPNLRQVCRGTGASRHLRPLRDGITVCYNTHNT